MKVSLLIFALIAIVEAKLLSKTRINYWNQYKVDYKKLFDSKASEEVRENIFWENLKTISLHNYEFRRGNKSFKMGINQFADMTFKEYSDMFKSNETMKERAETRSKGLKFNPSFIYGLHFKNKTSPESFDWRDRKALTDVKDQKKCGSCYAMSTIGALESHIFLKTGKLVELSEQEILDCAGDVYNSFQCGGGVAFRVFDYIKDRGGLSEMKDYPYEGKAGNCRAADNRLDIKLKGYGYVLSRENDNVLMKAVAELGPLVVSIDIDHESFMRYSSGIYIEEKCTDDVNHGALLVGYGSEDGVNYWIVKNSFGVTWGESGYIRIARNYHKDCGLSLSPIYPILQERKAANLLNNFTFTEKTFEDFISRFKSSVIEKNPKEEN